MMRKGHCASVSSSAREAAELGSKATQDFHTGNNSQLPLHITTAKAPSPSKKKCYRPCKESASWAQWLTPVIVATQEADIRRMQFKASPRETLS
jgi:hypothetical protein